MTRAGRGPYCRGQYLWNPRVVIQSVPFNKASHAFLRQKAFHHFGVAHHMAYNPEMTTPERIRAYKARA